MKPQELNRLLLNDKDVRGSLGKQGIRFLMSNQYSLSKGQRLSRDNKLFRKIKDKNPSVDISQLSKFFSQLESRYESKSLAEDVPEEIEFED